jgi:hypothetical protein
MRAAIAALGDNVMDAVALRAACLGAYVVGGPLAGIHASEGALLSGVLGYCHTALPADKAARNAFMRDVEPRLVAAQFVYATYITAALATVPPPTVLPPGAAGAEDGGSAGSGGAAAAAASLTPVRITPIFPALHSLAPHIFRMSVAESGMGMLNDDAVDGRPAADRVRDGRRWLGSFMWLCGMVLSDAPMPPYAPPAAGGGEGSSGAAH